MKKVFWLSCCILFLSPLTTLAEESTSAAIAQSSDSSVQMTSESVSEPTNQTNTSSDEATTNSTGETTEATEAIDAAAVIATIQSDTGEETNSQTFSTQEQPSDMRQSLQTGIADGRITALTQAELDQLSDEQLAQANQLALRYSSDAMGFDLGFLGKIVRALWIDQTLSWSAIEAQLAFDPSSYATFSAMIPVMDQLQDYLNTLYPATGIFLTVNQTVSEEWLTSILTNLDAVEAQSTDETLFPGRIAWIIHAINESLYLPTVATETTSDSQQAAEKAETVVSSEGTTASTAEATAQDNSSLPKTNETKSPLLLIAGVVLILLVLLVFWRRKKK